ncbi:MAG: TonB-dependent receptor [Gammaproteobacteria bacterium]|nr:TonB-dependent receptor [Gammaproteobacteria bacterium]MYE84781.1 TonB-dependent receptor [Gammaproteobacteria bacterium]MYG12602.1 TonB-dependent receptor [Gammaproteobacteria bacterium]MYH16191.1 TonB-dependent receptor [Gammaproteobacteria bacterium]MYK30082.1 TonB-dependent receptor [Gammaproteobacteria bacterium]
MTFCRFRSLATRLVALTVLIPGAAVAQGAPEAAEASGPIEEILVTARKRTETLQDTPVAVTVVTADQIEDFGVQSLADISKMTAGLLFDSEFTRGANRPVIRGQANILGDSGVSYFIDGVYVSGSIDDYDLDDVERIEIVKGPQSALYGRNTYSGAINLVTRSPGDELRANVEAEIAGDEEFLVRASISGPLSDTLAAGLTLRHYEMGGHVKNEFDGKDIGKQESRSISGVLSFTPNERLTARARAYYAERDDGQPAIFARRYFDNNCYPDDGALYGGAGRYFCGTVKPGDVNIDWPVQAPGAGLTDDALQLSLKVDYDLNEQWQLTYIAGYGERDAEEVYDGDYLPTSFQVSNFTPNGFPFAGFPVPPFSYAYVGSMTDFTFANAAETDEWSQEVQLAFDADRVRGLVGAYYYKQDRTTRDIREVSDEQQALAQRNWFAEFLRMQGVCAANPICGSMAPFFGPTIVVPRDVNDIEIENAAVFGLVSFDLADNLTATLEARYQDEDIDQRAVAQDLGGPAGEPVISSASFDGFLPRVTLDWQPTDSHLLYVTYAEGTKPGGFNSTVAIEAGVPTYDEEEVKSIELGAKSVLADGQVRANVALFFNELTGYQLTQNVQAGQNAQSATVNAGDADINGLEAELLLNPSEIAGLTLRFNYAYTDAEYTEGFDQNEGVLLDVLDDRSIDCSTGDQFPDVDGCQSLFGSIDGKQIPRTAEHQMFADVEYRRPLTNGWEWYAGVSYIFESSKFAQVHNLAETGDTSVVNARMGLISDRYSIRVFGRNLNGEETAYNVIRYAEPSAFRRNFIASPRRDTYFGISLAVHL